MSTFEATDEIPSNLMGNWFRVHVGTLDSCKRIGWGAGRSSWGVAARVHGELVRLGVASQATEARL